MSLLFYIFRSMNGVATHTDAETNKTGKNKKQYWETHETMEITFCSSSFLTNISSQQ